MVNRFRLSSLIPGRLQELSIAPEAVLRRAGLPPGLLQQEKALLTTEQLFAFWSAVADESGDPGIGLALGSGGQVERYDPIQLAALSASSFRDAIERASRYKQLTCPEEIRLVRRAGDAYAIEFDWSLRPRALRVRRPVRRRTECAGLPKPRSRSAFRDAQHRASRHAGAAARGGARASPRQPRGER
jgi:Arabinose-binding domain of AraC transcription regulator, N-term